MAGCRRRRSTTTVIGSTTWPSQHWDGSDPVQQLLSMHVRRRCANSLEIDEHTHVRLAQERIRDAHDAATGARTVGRRVEPPRRAPA